MIGATFCSGIGAPEVAAPWVDWQLASEIEAFPCEVLQHRLKHQDARKATKGPRLWGDFTALRPRHFSHLNIPLPEIIVAGTPCQAFSVAGLRKGTADDRGNLTLQFVRTAHAIRNARPDGKLIVLWENVPGVLSDKGNAFGCFLAGLVGTDDALRTPDGGSWPSSGMVAGPRARAAWRVLDAQYFGVAQRRRRVFVVVDFGGAVDPAAVLFERKSLRGDTPPSRETGERPAPTISARTNGGGGLGTDFDLDGGLIANWPADVAPTLNAHFGDKMGLEDQHALAGGGYSSLPEVAMCLNAGGMGRKDAETETLIPINGGVIDVAHALRGEGFDASEDGTGRGTPLVPVAFAENSRGELRLQGGDGQIAPQLTTGGGKPGQGQPCIAFDCKGSEVQFSTDGSHPTLRSMGHNNSHQNGGGHAAVALSPSEQEGGATLNAVRRLTPRECERLQGFPDDYTLIPRTRRRVLKDKDAAEELVNLLLDHPEMTMEQALYLAADGPRYKALGNSMAVPVIRWIMDRIRFSQQETRT